MNVNTPAALAAELKKHPKVAYHLAGDNIPPLTDKQKQELKTEKDDTKEKSSGPGVWNGVLNPSFSGLLAKVPREVLHDPVSVIRHLQSKITVKEVPTEVLFPEIEKEGSDSGAVPIPGSSDQALVPLTEPATKKNVRRVPGPQPANTLRLVCISDTHTTHQLIDAEDLPPGDVLIHGGDFSDTGKPEEVSAFADWLESLGNRYRHKVVIAGNHDLSMDPDSYQDTWKRFGHPKACDPQEQIAKLRKVCTYLDHEAVTIDGVRFFGSPYQPWFYDWAFNLRRDGECRAKWATMPSPLTDTSATAPLVDVLITHGPPLGHGDLCKPPGGSGNQGCADLLDWVEAFPPQVHVFGHIHEGYGVTQNDKGTTFINASTMNVNYDPTNMNRPVVWDVPLPAVTNGNQQTE